MLTAIALSGCRPFFSPVDPGSAGFTGEAVLRNPPAGAALPAIERWESVADHADQPFALEITDAQYGEPGFFVEPRNPVGSRVVLTFAAPVSEQKLAAALILLGVNDGGTESVQAVSPDNVSPDGYRIAFRRPTAPDAITVRMRLIDPAGVFVSERSFAYLRGDVNGDGFVDADDDTIVVALHGVGIGMPGFDPRADVTRTGTIDEVSDLPTAVATVSELPGPPPSFDGPAAPTTFGVAFESNGGSAVAPQIVPEGGLATQPADPVRSGWIFGGWFADDVLTIPWDFGTDTITAATTIYARWDAYSYTVTFDSQGADVDADPGSIDVVSPETTVVSLPTEPTLAGFFFGGWWTAPGGSGGGGTEFTATTTVTAPITVYAYWSLVPTFTVTYESDGGSAVAPETVADGGLATDPGAPVRAGHSFDGWFTDAGLTTLWNFATDTVSADITLHAGWTPIDYVVSFNANGGIGTMGTQLVTYNGSVTLAASTFTRAGHRFMGWAETAIGPVLWNGGAMYTHTIETDRTLYAVWEPEFTVTYTGSLADSGTPPFDPNTYLTTDLVTVLGNTGALARANHTFGGWTDGTDSYVAGNDFPMPAGNVVLDPVWVLDTYTVTFETNGGSPVTAQDVPHGGLVTAPGDPTRLGYNFGGWYSDIGLTIPWNFGTDTITAPTTIYAAWAIYSYTVTFDSQGADVDAVPASINVDSPETTVGALPTEPTRAGYSFGGWWTAPNGGGTEFITTTVVTENITVYAAWTANTYSVIFDPDGGTGTMTPVAVDYWDWIVLPSSTFARPGYSFNGWAVTPAGPIIYVDEANYQHVTVGDQTLYALWTPEPEFAGGAGIPGDPYQVATPTHLNNVRNHLGATFAQTANIDLGVSPWNEGNGWEPIGTDVTRFTGTYDGGGFAVSGLTIDRSEDHVGLFGRIDGATIERVRLENVSVFGLINTGTLVGSSAVTSLSIVRDSYATGTVLSSSYNIGGLIGFAGEMTVESSFSAVSVESTLNAASLYIGGLIGRAASVTISDSYAVGTVTATGSQGFIGGLLGGGSGTSINRSYAAGRITTGGATAGGLVGDGAGVNVIHAFYDQYTTGVVSGIGLPRPTALMLREINFDGWNFSPGATWAIDEDTSYPYLQWYTGPAPLPATAFVLRDIGPSGGWIFYDKGSYSDGWRYLEAAPTDASASISWGPSGEVTLTSQDVGTGLENTDRIISVLGAGTAAQLARSQNTAGFTDWFLPSADELHLMYLNLHAESVGGFTTANHWSSTAEADDLLAWAHYFNNLGTFVTLRSNSWRVRHVRRF